MLTGPGSVLFSDHELSAPESADFVKFLRKASQFPFLADKVFRDLTRRFAQLQDAGSSFLEEPSSGMKELRSQARDAAESLGITEWPDPKVVYDPGRRLAFLLFALHASARTRVELAPSFQQDVPTLSASEFEDLVGPWLVSVPVEPALQEQTRGFLFTDLVRTAASEPMLFDLAKNFMWDRHAPRAVFTDYSTLRKPVGLYLEAGINLGRQPATCAECKSALPECEACLRKNHPGITADQMTRSQAFRDAVSTWSWTSGSDFLASLGSLPATGSQAPVPQSPRGHAPGPVHVSVQAPVLPPATPQTQAVQTPAQVVPTVIHTPLEQGAPADVEEKQPGRWLVLYESYDTVVQEAQDYLESVTQPTNDLLALMVRGGATYDELVDTFKKSRSDYLKDVKEKLIAARARNETKEQQLAIVDQEATKYEEGFTDWDAFTFAALLKLRAMRAALLGRAVSPPTGFLQVYTTNALHVAHIWNALYHDFKTDESVEPRSQVERTCEDDELQLWRVMGMLVAAFWQQNPQHPLSEKLERDLWRLVEFARPAFERAIAAGGSDIFRSLARASTLSAVFEAFRKLPQERIEFFTSGAAARCLLGDAPSEEKELEL